ncbi:MAG: Gfo/Idh/MocA family oxidoreductase [Pseudomonadota bacterium]
MTDAFSYPPPSRKLRIGFVGGGRGALVGEWHAMGVRMSNRWDIVAGALSSRPDVAAASAADWGIALEHSYASYEEMAEAEAARENGIDAVAICTPNHTHAPIAKAFMEAGIAVICDKPMTAHWAEAEDLAVAALSGDHFFAVTYPYIFHAMARQARAMVAAGMIGAVRQAHVEYVQEHAAGPKGEGTGRWRDDPQKSGRTGVTGDIGTHAFHLLTHIADRPARRLSARFHQCGAATGLEDTALMQLELEGGVPATLWCTQAAPGNACGLRLRIYGESGGIEWDQQEPETLRYTPIGEATRIISRGKGGGMLPEAEKLTRLPRGHAEALPDAWCNLYTEIAVALDAKLNGVTLDSGTVLVPDVADGARGVFFAEAAADSAASDGAWQDCWWEPQT